MNFSPQTVLRPREQVEAQLRAAIVDGTFAGGDRLPSETVLAREFGVSRTTVREALRSLSNDGLVRKVPGANGGTFVNVLDIENFSEKIGDAVRAVVKYGGVSLDELVAVRHLLEVPAAGFAALNRDEDDLVTLREALEASKQLEPDSPRADEVDYDFHVLVSKVSGNKLIDGFLSAFHKHRFEVEGINYPKEYRQRIIQQHEEILEAIQHGDAELARQHMDEHLSYLASISHGFPLQLADRNGPATED